MNVRSQPKSDIWSGWDLSYLISGLDSFSPHKGIWFPLPSVSLWHSWQLLGMLNQGITNWGRLEAKLKVSGPTSCSSRPPRAGCPGLFLNISSEGHSTPSLTIQCLVTAQEEILPHVQVEFLGHQLLPFLLLGLRGQSLIQLLTPHCKHLKNHRCLYNIIKHFNWLWSPLTGKRN